MNRPLALIEGNLAIPKPRPFDGLPPPFGARRRAAQTAAQQAIQDAVQRKPQQAHPSPFPPGVKHVLFYKAPPRRTDSHRFDAEMAEAKRYLEMGKLPARSSRSDYLLAAGIFAGCTIALTWLLVTCAMKDVENTNAVAVTPAVAAWQPEIAAEKTPVPLVAVVASAAPVAPVNADLLEQHRDEQAVPALPPVSTQAALAPSATLAQAAQNGDGSAAVSTLTERTWSQVAPSVPSSSVASKRADQTVARTSVTATQAKKTVKPVEATRLSKTHVDERVALNRTTHPVSKPAASKQPEWTTSAGAPRNDASTEDASWMNWAAQQHRPAPTMRASVPSDTSWNARMTQRRITDNPDAFK
ncbi:hypothetical protein PQQ86_37495 [Paraburkholderia sediminicola]|uniref:hypothetical protein n=1 Tax=Paraburkholderia sediminicola TaxID=458836 RepID=UPI0038BCE168